MLHLFAILNGAEGKLTTAALKASVLQGIGNLSSSAVTGSSMHQLACTAAENFISVLNTEGKLNNYHSYSIVVCI
jgi:UDP-N-acetylmuramate-alanine ligase